MYLNLIWCKATVTNNNPWSYLFVFEEKYRIGTWWQRLSEVFLWLHARCHMDIRHNFLRGKTPKLYHTLIQLECFCCCKTALLMNDQNNSQNRLKVSCSSPLVPPSAQNLTFLQLYNIWWYKHWWWLRRDCLMIVKRFGCTEIYNKALQYI